MKSTKKNGICNVCQSEFTVDSLTQCKLRILTIRGWEEPIIQACQSCMKDEKLVEFKESKAA